MLRELKLAILRFGESAIGARQLEFQFPSARGENRSAHMVQLEERVLYSAAPMNAPQEPVVDIDMVPDGDVVTAADFATQDFEYLTPFTSESTDVPVLSLPAASELIIVDPSVDGYGELVEGIIADDRGFEVVFLHPEQDGIEQIADLLSRFSQLDAIHVVSHGTDESVQLGRTQLTLDSLNDHAGIVARWGDALSSQGDLLFYGCNLAASSDGETLIEAISTLTNADVAASDNLTGHQSLGGDWVLEYAAGTVETASAFSLSAQHEWYFVLAATANNDSYSTGENAVLNESAAGVLNNDSGGVVSMPVLPGETLNYDASLDTNGSIFWEDSTGVDNFDWLLDPAIVRDTGPVGAPPGITASYVFDGSSGGLMGESFEDLGLDNPTDGDATFEIWFRPDSPSDNRGILFDIGSSTNGVNLRLYQDSGDSYVEYLVKNGGAITLITANITTEMDSGDFIQIAASIDVVTGTGELFVNGVSVGSQTNAGVTDWSDNSESSGLGKSEGSLAFSNDPHANSFEGEIAIFRFYESALDALEVQQNYDAINSGGSGSGLTVTGFDSASAAGAIVNVASDGSFTYNPGTLFDYLKDGESVSDTFSYTVEDAMSNSDTATVSITINGATEAPTAITPSSFIIDENTNTTGGQWLASLDATDEDSGDSFTYSIVPGGDSSRFSIGGSNQLYIDDGTLNYEVKSSYSVDVRVTDSGGNTYDETITVSVNDLNDIPTSISTTNFNVDENTDASSGFSVGTLVTTDEDVGETFTYSINGGTDSGKFAIGGTGNDELVLTDGVLDFENKSIYWVKVRSTDSGGEWFEEWVSVDVNDLNETPTGITPTNPSIDENTDTSGGRTVATLSTSDPDDSDSFSYALVGGADMGNFAIGGVGSDELVLTAGILNHEVKASYVVDVQVTDGGGGTYVETITVDVNDLNESPTGISPTNPSIDENTDTAGGLTVATLSTTDPDDSDTFSYALVGGADIGNFSIGGAGTDELILNAGVLNHETKANFVVDVQVTDGSGGTYVETITVAVNDLNESPTAITPSILQIADNTDTSGGFSLGMLTASDEDSPETFIYSIQGGADSSNFTIGGAGSDELILSAGMVDYSTKSIYSVLVRATDSGGNTYDETISVNVIGENDPPAISNQAFSIDENSSNGTIVGSVTASDADPEIGYTKLYWVDVESDDVRRINLDGTGDLEIASHFDGTDATGPRDVTVDAVNGKVYWTNNNTATIWVADLNGDNAQPVISGLDSPQGIAVDPVSGKIFWVEGMFEEIWHADLDGSNASSLIDTTSNPKDLAIDSAAEKIYWTDDGTNEINRANLDGSNIETIVAGGAWDPWGIALDIKAGKVYWSEPSYNEIYRADMVVGATPELVISGANEPRDLTLDVVNGIVYWTAAATDQIEGATFDGTPIAPVTSTGDWPTGIAIGPDAPNLTYAITNGNTGGAFSIDSITGEVSVANTGVLNFESSPVFNLTVEVTDNLGSKSNAMVTINLNDANEAPTAITPTSLSINENVDTNSGVSLGMLSAADVDDGDVFSYSIAGGDDSGSFSIGGAGDELILTAGVLNHEAKSSFVVDVEVTDGGGNTYVETVTVDVNDLNETPTAISPTNPNVDENIDTTGGYTVATLTTTDPDDSDTFSYAIAGGADSGSFSIGGAGDELILTAGVLNHEAQSSFVVDVEVTDSGGNTYVETVTVDVNDLNETPTAISPTNPNVDENIDTTGGYTVATLTTTDPDDSDTFSYAIVGGADSGSFSIGGAGDELILTAGVLNHEAKSSLVVDVEVTDGGGNTYVETVTVDVNDLNETPTAISPTNPDVDENIDTTSGYTVATLTAADPDDSDTFSYAIVGGADSGSFSIGGAGDELILTAGVLNHEAKSSYVVDVEVTDGGGNTYVETVTVDVNDLNETPTAISPTNPDVDENIDTTSGYTVATLTAADPDDSDTFSYAIVGGADSGSFSIGGAGDELILTAGVLNHEAKSSFVVDVEVTDGGGNTYVETVTVDVNDLNETPTAISPTNPNVDENIDTTGGYTVATLTTTDPDDSDTFSYAIAGGADSGSFSIGGAGDELILTAGVLNHEATSSFVVDVEVTDAGGNTYVETITVAVSDLNDAPTAISPAVFSVDENTDTSGGFSVGTLSASDEDDLESFTYSIVGGPDSGSFTIGGFGNDELILTAGTLDHEMQDTYFAMVRVIDSGGSSYDELVTVSVDDLNEAPTAVTPTSIDVVENTDSSSGLSLGKLNATDEDFPETFTYSIQGGADATKFSIGGIDSDELNLTDGVLDFESQSSYSVIVRVTDSGGNQYDETITISVEDLNEAPTAITPGSFNIDEFTDTSSGVSLGVLGTTDQDSPETFTYSIEGGADAGRFSIGGVGGNELILTDGTLDHESQGTYSVVVRVTDSAGNQHDELITVDVNDRNDAPTVSLLPVILMGEDDPNRDINLRAVFADVEDSDADLVYTITNVTNSSLFDSVSINAFDRVVLDLAANQNGSSMITVRGTDSGGKFVEATFRVQVKPVNDDPFVSTPVDPIVVDEDAKDSLISLLEVFDDVDIDTNGDRLSYTIVANSNSSLVDVQILKGRLQLNYQDDQFGDATIVVQATDQVGKTVIEEFIVQVNPIQDPTIVTDDFIQTIAAGPIVISPAEVLANDVDIDSTVLNVVTVPGSNVGGVVAIDANGNLVFTPDAEFSGIASFEYIVIADGVASSSASVGIVANVGPTTEPEPKPDTEPDQDTEDPVEDTIVTGSDVPDDDDEQQFGPAPVVTTSTGFSDLLADDVPNEFDELENSDESDSFGAYVLNASYVYSGGNGVQFGFASVTGNDSNRGQSVSAFDPILAAVFWEGLDSAKNEYFARFEFESPEFVAASAGILTLSYLAWLINGGVLLTSFVSSLGGHFDPLPLVESGASKKEEDGVSVEQMVESEDSTAD